MFPELSMLTIIDVVCVKPIDLLKTNDALKAFFSSSMSLGEITDTPCCVIFYFTTHCAWLPNVQSSVGVIWSPHLRQHVTAGVSSPPPESAPSSAACMW